MSSRKLLLIILLPLGALYSNVPEIASLKDIQSGPLKELRTEIAVNLRSVSRKKKPAAELRFFKYRIRENDRFYPVLARFSQDEDTVSSLNGIIHPNDLEAGQILYIPNIRGLFLKKSEYQTEKTESDESAILFLHPQTNEEYILLPGAKKSPGERSLFRGEGFIFPVEDGIQTSGFGMRRDPFSKRMVFHGGIDIAAPSGTPVYASRSGNIAFSGEKGGYGKLVVIDHSFGYETLYGHLSEIRVTEGAEVKKGDLIGYVGSTGRSTGPHLHFELRKNGRKVRPDLKE